MRNFSYFFVLLFATMFFSSCEQEDGLTTPLKNTEPTNLVQVDPGDYLFSNKQVLPDNCFYVDTVSGLIVPEAKLSKAEVFINDMSEAGGVLTIDPNHPNVWSMSIPESLQKLDTRDGGRDGVCLWGFDYYIIPRTECSTANVWDIDLIYNQGTIGTGKFITLSYPWMKWGENGNLVQSGLQMFADSVYYGLLDIGVPSGFTVCVFATAWEDPTSGKHIYTINLYVNGVPSGVHVSFMDIFTVNCNGTGYANYDDIDLEINQFCNNQPSTCLAIGGSR
jgi:hypothetical protein